MPLKTFATKDAAPADVQDQLLALADGSFALLEEPDVSPLQAELTDLKRKLDAADKLSRKAAADILAADIAKKAAEQGITGEALAKIRADARAEVMAEVSGDIELGKKALEENRTLKVDAKVKALAVQNGVRPERLDAWWRLNAGDFDLTSDGAELIVKGKEGVSVAKHIVDLKTTVPEFYAGSKGAGGGAGGGGGSGNGGGSGTIDPLQNPAAALAAARAAGKTE